MGNGDGQNRFSQRAGAMEGDGCMDGNAGQVRLAQIERVTSETSIAVEFALDGTGALECSTGIGFFDHMLAAFARHGLFDLRLSAKGDLEVDGHHTVEDCGIVLGRAFSQAIGDKRGIVRFGDMTVLMDEALIAATCDISGRGALYWDVDMPLILLGAFDSSLVKEFFTAFAANAGITLHIRRIAGENAHHIAEASFKAVARALRQAVAFDPRECGALPSTKGML